MRKKYLWKASMKNIFVLLFAIIGIAHAPILNAQDVIYESSNRKIVGTSDSRLAASIVETDEGVVMNVFAIGEIRADALDFTFFYKPEVLVISDTIFNQEFTLPSQNPADFANISVFIDTALLRKNFEYGLINLRQKGTGFNANYSGNVDMNAFVVDIGRSGSNINDSTTYLYADPNEIVPVFKCYFKKVNPGAALLSSDFGIGVKTSTSGGRYSPRWAFDNLTLSYANLAGTTLIPQNQILYRSHSSVITNAIDNIGTVSATFHGTFHRSQIPPAEDLINSSSNTSGTGSLHGDSILQYGFIYTTEDVDLSTEEFSHILTIDGTPYPFPTTAEITAGTFMRGSKTFFIESFVNTSSSQSTDFQATITNLTGGTTYFAWAFTKYRFETSELFPMVGGRKTFGTVEACQYVEIGNIYIIDQPTCRDDNGNPAITTGSIYIDATGGRGTYEYAFQENGPYTELLSSKIISGLHAGTYRIYIRDKAYPECGVAVSRPITLRAINNDLNITVTPNPATSCGTDNGSIDFTVTGGKSPYSFTLNGIPATPSGNTFTGLMPGLYVIDAIDNIGCSVSSGEIHLTSSDGGLSVNVSAITPSDCGAQTGAFTLTVTNGTEPYTYQIDGNTLIESDNHTFTAENLAAGNYTFYVTDSTGCYAEGRVPIQNNDYAIFTVTASSTPAGCDGTSGGTIALHVEGNTSPYVYSIDRGASWTGFPSADPANVTIPDLAQGNYNVIVRDINNCTYSYQNISVGRENTSDLVAGTINVVEQPTCNNRLGKIKIEVSGGSGSYEYSINGDSLYTDLPIGRIISNLGAGTYRVYIRDKNAPICGIAVSEPITLRATDSNMDLYVTANNAQGCGVTDGSLSINLSGGRTPYSYRLNGLPVTPNGNQIENLSPGIYVLNITDADNCTISSGEITIGAGNGGLDVVANGIEHTTCDNRNGGFVLSVGNGQPPYLYQINGEIIRTMNGNQATISNLHAGLHIWNVTDSSGCYAAGEVVILNNGPQEFSASVSTTDAQCNGLTGGRIVIDVSNGAAPYYYSLDNGRQWTEFPSGGTQAVLDNISQGVYDILLRDADSCLYGYQNAVIGIGNTVIAGTVTLISQPECDAQTGSIKINVSGGSGEYQYILNGIGTYRDLDTNGIIQGLSAGTYVVYIQDKNAPECGTAVSEAITLRAMDSNLELVVTPVNASSCGTADGALNINITGGYPPYTYTLNGTGIDPVDNKISGLRPGIYIVNATDSTGCLVSSGRAYIEAEDGGLRASVSEMTATTCGKAEGSFTITVSGGTDPYVYQIDGGIEITQNSNVYTFRNLNAGNHIWKVKDNTGCYAEERITILNNDKPGYSVSVTTTDAHCDGITGGTLTIHATGGEVPYRYSLDNGNTWNRFAGNQSSVTITNLAQGKYDILVEDTLGCTFQYRNAIIQRDNSSNLMAGTISIISQPSCGNASGSIQLNVSGGSGNYRYSFSGIGTYRNLDPSGIIEGLSAGTYRVYIQDKDAPACGTAVSEAITLHAIDSDMELYVTARDASACGFNDGALIVDFRGGTAPYTYTLNGRDVTPSGNEILNLPSGSYILDITDASLCTVSSGAVRIESADGGLATSISGINPTTCGKSEGSFTITITGGVAPFRYQINGGVVRTLNDSTITFSDLPAGNHTWIIYDAVGCNANGRETIINNDKPAFAITVNTTNALCDGISGGSITINVNGGQSPYQYSLNNGNNWENFDGNNTAVTITDLAQGSYDITVKDVTGCTFQYRNAVIGRDNRTDLMVGTVKIISQPLCRENTGSIHVQVSGGGGTYQYSMNGTGNYTELDSTGIISGLAAGTYKIYIQDKNAPACGTAISEPITLRAMDTDLDLVVTPSNASGCGIDDGSLTLSIFGGTSPYTYQLNGQSVTPVGNTIGGLTPGTYVVDAIDATGCLVSSGQIIIEAADGGLKTTISGIVPTLCGLEQGQFRLTVTDGTAPYIFQINGNVIATTNDDDFLFRNLPAGNHTWSVYDVTGCYAEGRETIINSDKPGYYITVNTTDALCDGITGGTMTITATGGSAPYQYSFDNGNSWAGFTGNQTSVTVTNLPQGNYSIIVRDTSGCTFQYRNAVIERNNFSNLKTGTITIVSQPTCGNALGSIKIEVSGGGGNYQYSLNGTSAYHDLDSTGIINGLTAGTYKFYIQDKDAPACGTAITEAITLRAMDSDLDLIASPINGSGCGNADGKLVLHTTGGTAPYTYMLNGNNVSPVQDTITGLMPGIYIVDATDYTGCLVSSGEIILGAADGGLTVNVLNIDSTTCGNTDGEFTLMVTNGSAPYTFQINGGIEITQNDPAFTFRNLSAGNHVWRVTDYMGCYAEERQTIINSDNPGYRISVNTTNALCDGISGGTISIYVTGGSAPFRYSLNNGNDWVAFTDNQTSVLIPDLAQGSYEVLVQDQFGCTFQYRNAVIGRDNTTDLMTGTIRIVSQPGCRENNGSIHIQVSGGGGSYQYRLNGIGAYTDLDTSGVISGLGAGTYRIHIQDRNAPACGTAISEPIVLRAMDTDLDLVATPVNASSCGTSDGYLIINISGGISPYSYKLNGNPVSLSNNIIPSLAPGLYIVDATDSTGCVVTSGQVIIGADDGGLDVAVSNVVETLCGIAEGAFTLTVSGGTAPFTFQVNGGIVTTTNDSSMTFLNLPAGNHTWNVIDASGCYAEGRETIINSDKPGYNITVKTTNALCDGISGGTLTINATDGTIPYRYSLDNGTLWENFPGNQNSVTISDLPQGSYTVIVMDNTGCTFQYRNAVVGRDNSSDLMAGTIRIVEQPTCGNNDGSIQIEVSGGTGHYQYFMNGSGSFTDLDSTGIISGLSAGTYKIYIQDKNAPACGIAVSEAITLRAMDSDMELRFTVQNATGCGNDDGILTFEITGGTAPYSYTLNGLAITPNGNQVEDLTPGIYVLDVTDAEQCLVSSGEITIEAGSGGLNVTVSGTQHSLCGQSTGAFDLTVIQGSAPYTFILDGGVQIIQNEALFTFRNLPAGSHLWKVTDNTGCYAEGRHTITNNDQPGFGVTVSATNALCDGINGGSLRLEVSGGNAPYQYSLDNGNHWSGFTANQNTTTIPDLAQGSYDIVVKDNSGCTFMYRNAVIEWENTTDLMIGTVRILAHPTCDDNIGSLHVQVSGGSGFYQYLLNGNGSYTDLDTSGIIQGLGIGTYRIYVQDKNAPACGTAISEPVVLQALDTDLELVVTPVNASSCGVPDGELIIAISGGIPPYIYTLNGDTVTLTGGNITGLTSGLYVVDATDFTGCKVTSGQVILGADDGGLTTVITEMNDTRCGESEGSFKLTVSDGVPPYTFQINGGVVRTINDDFITFDYLPAGNHTWNVLDGTGCYAEGRQTILNSDKPGYYITINTTDVLCDGTTGGTLTIQVYDGAAPFRYSLDNGNTWVSFTGNQASETISDLPQGNYTVTVMDNDSCTFQYRNAVIGRDNSSELMTGTIRVLNHPTCNNATGSVSIEVYGGSGDYQYSLNGNGNYRDLDTTGIINGLQAGSYRIYIQDRNHPSCGTAVSQIVTLYATDSDMRLYVSTRPSSSCGSADGELIIDLTGGIAPYSYTLNGETVTPSGNSINGLSAGLYTLEVTDDANCTVSSGEVRIEAADGGLQVTVNEVNTTLCGERKGSITITVNGGNAPYRYQIDGGVVITQNENSITFKNLGAGNHIWKVTDRTGCYAEGRETIINSDKPSFAFEATATDIQCDGITGGDILIKVTGGNAPFQYTYGNNPGWILFDGNDSTAFITGLSAGSYDIIVKDADDCTFEYKNITIQMSRSIIPPTVTTPQTFCSDAMISDIQIEGTGIKWYDSPTGGLALPDNTALISGNVYYATQTLGICESRNRTSVKAIIDDRTVVEAPRIKSPQEICGPATIADIMTYGNTNITWYDAPAGGNILPLTTPLVDGQSYYAAQSAGGTCISINRTEVEIILGTEVPEKPAVLTPQYFCEGAILGNIAVPNNQIIWYATLSGGSPLSSEIALTDGIYYAAQKAGDCESTERQAVEIVISTPLPPKAPVQQSVCSGSGTLADLRITGSGIVWYDAATGGNRLPLTTPLVDGTVYYAAQSSGNCEGARIGITINTNCYTVQGTVFPFVYEDNPAFDSLFPITVKLYEVPGGLEDPIDELMRSQPLYSTTADYYDGTVFVPGTPKNPGSLISTSNPGLPINWTAIGKIPGTVDTTTLTGIGDEPNSNIGLYTLEDVAEGEYILEISRKGFLIRWAKITINSTNPLGHRELIPGDVNHDHEINFYDISKINTKASMLGSHRYDPTCDFNGDGYIDYRHDNSVIIFNMGASIELYEETLDWLMSY